ESIPLAERDAGKVRLTSEAGAADYTALVLELERRADIVVADTALAEPAFEYRWCGGRASSGSERLPVVAALPRGEGTMKKPALHWQILIAIVLAVFAGWLVNRAGAGDASAPGLFDVSFLSVFKYLGALFLNALKMIIVPLILSSIIVGMAGIGSSGNLGALDGRTLLFYIVTTIAGILVGLTLINIVGPGYGNGQPAGDLLALSAPADD